VSEADQIPHALADLPAELTAFYRAWRKCGNGELVPSLSAYLDAPSFGLQPYVSIFDLHDHTDVRIRLFGTGLVTLAGQDFTSRTVAPIYSREDMAFAASTAWRAAGHPAGYTCLRAVKSATGLLIQCECICLPLLPPAGVPRCMITMLHVPEVLPRIPADGDMRVITAFKLLNWVDIGAGIPE
jgi:hypothetical protein